MARVVSPRNKDSRRREPRPARVRPLKAVDGGRQAWGCGLLAGLEAQVSTLMLWTLVDHGFIVVSHRLPQVGRDMLAA